MANAPCTYLFFVINADEEFAEAAQWRIMANVVVDYAVIVWLVDVLGMGLSPCHKVLIDLFVTRMKVANKLVELSRCHMRNGGKNAGPPALYTYVAGARGRNGSGRYDTVRLGPRQFAAVTFVQQNLEDVMGVDVRVHRHNAHGLLVARQCVAGDRDAIDHHPAHIQRVVAVSRLEFGRLDGVLQLLHIAVEALPAQRVRCD